MKLLFETDLGFGNVIPETKLATVGDIAIFECLELEDVTWKFNMGNLPSRTYSYFRFESYSYFLAVLVESNSYFGQYSCEGINYNDGTAYYSVAALNPCKLREKLF